MVNEQKVAFTLMDLKDLIRSMDSEQMLCDEDYTLLKNAHNKIVELNGFVEGYLW